MPILSPPAVSSAAIAIVNAALGRTGGNRITGSDFGTGVSTDGTEKNLAFDNYEQIVRTALMAKPWRFARKVAACTLVVDGDGNPVPPDEAIWKYSWGLPADVLLLRTLIRNGWRISYEIDKSGDVLTNYKDSVLAAYAYRADESLWPADFSEVITQFMEEVYLRFDSRTQEADDRRASALKLMDSAAIVHGQEEYPRDPRRFPLIYARRTGYGFCYR